MLVVPCESPFNTNWNQQSGKKNQCPGEQSSVSPELGIETVSLRVISRGLCEKTG